MTGKEIRQFLASVKGGEGEKGLKVVDFQQFKSEGGEVKKEEKKQPAAPVA